MAVLYIQAFVFVVLFGKMMRKIFFGQLRAAEMEHLIERSWYAVTETCLAFTVFRDDFSPKFVALFTVLLFLKSFHWLAEDRVDYMERSPIITFLFHLRAVALLISLGLFDAYFIQHAYYSTILKGPSVQMVFGFEYAILLTVVVHTFVKYILHTIDLQNENPWESKTVCLLYTELILSFIKMVLYMLFLFVMIKVHTFPLFAIRAMYLTLRTFKKALNDVIMSRRAIRNMNTLYPDATPEELASGDNVCIICREEMVSGCKKLPCNHIFHTSCLRSWFQRQQTCPTCRMDILRQPTPATRQPAGAPQANVPPPAGVPPPIPPVFPGFPFAAWPQDGQPPVVQAPQPGVPTAATTAGTSTSPQLSTAGVSAPTSAAGPIPSPQTSTAASVPPFMMPPFFMPMPFMVPPPVPDANYSGMTEEELKAMEGQERQNLEARLQCLHNIHTLLDAAMIQIQQYTTVVQNLGVQFPSAFGATGSPGHVPPGPHARTDTTDSGSSPRMTTTAEGASSLEQSASDGAESGAKAREISSLQSSSSTLSSTSDMPDLEGAVGYTPSKSDASSDLVNSQADSNTMNEIRRRRLQKFSTENLQGLGEKDSSVKSDKHLDLD